MRELHEQALAHAHRTDGSASPERKRAPRRAAIGIALAGAIGMSWASIGHAQDAITDEQARRIALEHVPGTVLALEREDEDGAPQIDVDVRGEDGRVHEVTIDARDGRVIDVELEDDDEEDDD